MTDTPIRIVLIDDHKMARESWRMLLNYDARFNVVHEFEHGNDAIQDVPNISADVLLVDINMYPINGLEITQRLLEKNPQLRIIGLSVNNQPLYATRMLEIGARGFITKGSTFEEITNGIVEVHKGGQYLCEEIKAMLNN